MTKIAFIGLGAMGFPMAGHLAQKGHEVTVYNRSSDKMRKWRRQYGGRAADNVADAVSAAEWVITCLGREDDVRAVLSTATLDALPQGAFVIDHSTTSATLARALDKETRGRGVSFCDAPVSGGQEGAERGRLAVMLGCDEGQRAAISAVLRAYAASVTRMGDAGAGQLAKMVNQICAAAVLQGLAEGLTLARKAGLDIPTLLSAIGSGAASSWQMTNRASSMAEGRFGFGFAVDWMLKDLRIALEQGKALGAELPVTMQLADFYRELQETGDGRLDSSALIKRLV